MLGMRPPRGSRFVRLELHDGDALAIGGRVLAVRYEPRHCGSQVGHPGVGFLNLFLDSRLEPGAKDDDNHASLLMLFRLGVTPIVPGERESGRAPTTRDGQWVMGEGWRVKGDAHYALRITHHGC